MTRRFRQWFTVMTIAVFFIVAPIIVVTAAGYRWSGWKLGFSKTSTLIVQSTPRANLALNGQLLGPTPKRVTGLVPGTYQVQLRAEGYAPWQQYVRLLPGQSSLIGPIRLFRPSFQVTATALENGVELVSDQQTHMLYTIRNQGEQWSIQPDGPANSSPWTTPQQPLGITSKGRWSIVSTSDQTLIFEPTNPAPAWSLPHLDQISWQETSTGIFYGLADQTLGQYNISNRSVASLGPATSYYQWSNEIWYTTVQNNVTTLITRRSSGQLLTNGQFAGNWKILQGQRKTLIIQHQDTRQAIVVNLDQPSLTTPGTELGRVDHWWWATRQPPIWQDGVNLKTLSSDQQPILIDRGPELLTVAEWIVPYHIMVTIDHQYVSIRSISAQQGRSTLLRQELPTGGKLLTIDVKQKSVWIATGERLERWTW